MKKIPTHGTDRGEELPIELLMQVLNGAVDSLELDGTEDCTKVELKQLFRDLAEVLYLEDANECVRVMMSLPSLLMAVESHPAMLTYLVTVPPLVSLSSPI